MNVKLTTVKSFLFFVAVLANLIDEVLAYESKCRPLRFINGRSRYRWRGRSVQFNCIRGFQLVGAKYATCINGKWDASAPICVRYGCPAPSRINGQFLESYRGAVVKIVCNPGYTLVGSPSVYCNGNSWNETFPTCNVTNLNPSTSCDFEDPDLCGWSHDPMHDFDWSRRTVSASVGNFSPPFDHTPGLNGSGSYMYREIYSFKDKAENYTTRLYSPVYPYQRSYSSCFKFWYFITGSLAGSLKVYVKPEGVELFDLIPSFWINEGETKKWLPGFFTIEPMETPFQIVVEAVSGSKLSNVMAFDDVTLGTGDDCVVREETTSTMETTSSVNPEDNSVDFPSCRNQCNFGVEPPPKSATVSDIADWIEVTRCSCHEVCVRDGNCCPDYYDYCSYSASSPTTTTTTATTKHEVNVFTTSLTPVETTTPRVEVVVEEETNARRYQDFNNETNEIDPRNPIPDWRGNNITDLGRKGEEDVAGVTTTRKPVQVEKGVAKISGRNGTVVEVGKVVGGAVNGTTSVRKEVGKANAETIARSKVIGKKVEVAELPDKKPEMNFTKSVSGGNDAMSLRPIKTDVNRTSGNGTRKAKKKDEETTKSSSTTTRSSSTTTTTTSTTTTTTTASTSTSTSSPATTPARFYKQLKPNNIKSTLPEKPSRSNMVNETPYHKGKPKELSGKELPQAIKRKNEEGKESAFRGILEIAGTSLAVLVAVILGIVWYRRTRNRKSERDSMVEDSDSIVCHMDSSTVERESHSLICIRPGGLAQAT